MKRLKKHQLYPVWDIQNLKDMLEKCASRYAHNPAFRLKTEKGDIREVSYIDFYNDVNALGTALTVMGLKDKNIAVIGENRYEWCVTYLSVVNGVGTIVPLDRELPVDDIENLIEQSEASAVVFSALYVKTIKAMLGKVSSVKHWICMDDQPDEQFLSYQTLLKDGYKSLEAGFNKYMQAEINADQSNILLFTSGTTGHAKGVMLSHRNICTVITGVSATVKVKPSDSVLSILPLHHTYECTLGFLTIIYNGASIAFSEGLKHIAKNMKEYRPSILVTVPLLLENVYSKVWKQAKKQNGMRAKLIIGQMISGFLFHTLRIDIRRKLFQQIHENFGGNLRLFITGAAAISPDVSKGLRKWGFMVLQGYGLTECAPLVTGNRDFAFRDDSVGIPIPGVEIKIDKPDKHGIGEILVRGANVMQGYFKNLSETEKVIIDGWFHTGDLGKISRKGFLHITGRCKNVIVTKNGKNVFPEELEYYIKDSPLVGECIVYGELDERSGETHVKAHIFPNMDEIRKKLMNVSINIDETQIYKVLQGVIQNVNRRLPLYKHIRDITIRDREFEMTTTHKVKRHSQ